MSSSFRESLFGTPGEFRTTPTTTGAQQGIFDQLIAALGGEGGLFGQGIGAIGSQLGGGQDFIEALQRPELRRFEQETIPGIAEAFTRGGGQRTSAFGQQLGAAGAGLAENLAAQRAGLGVQQQQSGLQQLMALLGLSQQQQFATAFQPGQAGGLSSLFGGLGSGLGMAAGGAAGGGIGAGVGIL